MGMPTSKAFRHTKQEGLKESNGFMVTHTKQEGLRESDGFMVTHTKQEAYAKSYKIL